MPSPERMGRPDLVAHGQGSEWVESTDKTSFVRWYKGGWRENRLHGVGTILSESSGHTLFCGRFDRGKRDGYGREFSPDRKRKVVYRGQFTNDKKTGVGAFYFEDESGGPSDGRMKYEGAVKNGRFDGPGVLYHKPTEIRAKRQVQYSGNFRKGVKSGYGAEFNRKGEIIYAGYYRLDFPHGFGKAYHQNWTGHLSYMGKFEVGSKEDVSVPHGGFGMLFLRDGRVFVSHFCMGATDPIYSGTMYYPEASNCLRVTGRFDKTDVTWVSKTGIQPEKQIWRGRGRALFRDGSIYEGCFRDDGKSVYQNISLPHGKYGLKTMRNLNQQSGRWRLGSCLEPTFSRLVVRRGFAIVLSCYEYPSHIPNPAASEHEADKFEELLLRFNFTVWREDNARRSAVQNLLVEAAAHLNAAAEKGQPHDCLFVFTSGLCRRPGTVCCYGDMREMPFWEDYLSDAAVPPLRKYPKFFVSQCSHAPRETKGWSMQPRLEITRSKNVFQLYATRTGESIWDAGSGSAKFIDKFVEIFGSASQNSASKKSFPGIDIASQVIQPMETFMDELKPFEILKSKTPSDELPMIQFLTQEQIKQRDSEHLKRCIKAHAEDIVGAVVTSAIFNRICAAADTK